MDVYGIEALLGLPEFHVIDQIIRPKRLDVHLERRDTSIVCPRCQTCCSRVKERRSRCIRDLPILERPVMLWLHLRRFECSGCHHRPWEKSERKRNRSMCYYSVAERCSFQSGNSKEGTRWDTSHKPP